VRSKEADVSRHCSYGVNLSPRRNGNYFPKHQQPSGLYNGGVVFS
jgi:hypothetical protein